MSCTSTQLSQSTLPVTSSSQSMHLNNFHLNHWHSFHPSYQHNLFASTTGTVSYSATTTTSTSTTGTVSYSATTTTSTSTTGTVSTSAISPTSSSTTSTASSTSIPPVHVRPPRPSFSTPPKLRPVDEAKESILVCQCIEEFNTCFSQTVHLWAKQIYLERPKKHEKSARTELETLKVLSGPDFQICRRRDLSSYDRRLGHLYQSLVRLSEPTAKRNVEQQHSVTV